jgi:hypothetical protein
MGKAMGSRDIPRQVSFITDIRQDGISQQQHPSSRVEPVPVSFFMCRGLFIVDVLVSHSGTIILPRMRGTGTSRYFVCGFGW